MARRSSSKTRGITTEKNGVVIYQNPDGVSVSLKFTTPKGIISYFQNGEGVRSELGRVEKDSITFPPVVKIEFRDFDKVFGATVRGYSNIASEQGYVDYLYINLSCEDFKSEMLVKRQELLEFNINDKNCWDGDEGELTLTHLPD
jgi:hypothetical protein